MHRAAPAQVHVVAQEPDTLRLLDPTKRAEFFFAQGRKWRVNKIHKAGDISDLVTDISSWLSSGLNATVVRPTKVSDFISALDLAEIFTAVLSRTSAVVVASVSSTTETSERIFDFVIGDFSEEQELVHVKSVEELDLLLIRARNLRKSHGLKITASFFRILFFSDNFTASVHLVALHTPEALRTAHFVARREVPESSALARNLAPLLGGNCKVYAVLDAPWEIAWLAFIDDVGKLVNRCVVDREPLEAFSVVQSVHSLVPVSLPTSPSPVRKREAVSLGSAFRIPGDTQQNADLDSQERIIELELALNQAKNDNRFREDADFAEVFRAYEATIEELTSEIRALQDERSKLLLTESQALSNRETVVLRELRELRQARDTWEKEKRKFAVGGRCADVFMRKLHAAQQALVAKTREADALRQELHDVREKERKFSAAKDRLSSENEVLTKISGDLTQEVAILRQAILTTGSSQETENRLLRRISLPEGRSIGTALERCLGHLSRAKREVAAAAPQAVPGVLKAERHAEIAKTEAETFRVAAERLQAVLLRLISRPHN